MFRSSGVALLVAGVMAASVVPASGQMNHDEPMSHDEHMVGMVVESFHSALNEGRGEDALALLAEDATILEGGGSETRAEYESHHLSSDMAFAQAVSRERGDLNITVQGDVAWVTSTSRAVGEWRGREIDSAGAELMVLSRGPDGWMIRSISWS